MNTANESELQKAKDIAGTAHVFAIIALVTIAIALITKGGAIGEQAFSTDFEWRERITAIGLTLIGLLPAALLFESVNRLRMALKHYAEGDFFSVEASTRVAQSGDYAVEAMLAVILVVPNLTVWIMKTGVFDIHLEPEYIGMLAFSLFVATAGRILTVAAQLKTENDAFI